MLMAVGGPKVQGRATVEPGIRLADHLEQHPMSATEPATVTVTLGSTPYVLIPTVDRMRVLNRLQGGFLALFRSVGNLEGDTMALVIAAGTGIRGKPVEDLTRAVYEAGLEDLVEPLTSFLTLCCNGGRDPVAVKAKPASEDRGASEVVKDADPKPEGEGSTPRESTAA